MSDTYDPARPTEAEVADTLPRLRRIAEQGSGGPVAGPGGCRRPGPVLTPTKGLPMSYLSDAHAEWHAVNGAYATCPLDCGAISPAQAAGRRSA